jgi:beta-glucosidase
VTDPHARDVILAAHRLAVDVLRTGPGDFPVGLTLALHDFQAPDGGEETMTEFRHAMADIYLEQLREDDFVGVQNYGRMVIGPEGRVKPATGVELNQMGEEFYPQGLGGAIRLAAQIAGVPIYVTENGMATEDDSRRLAYFESALTSMADCIEDGIDVRGYFAWSAFDNFEWVAGYGPKFGIIAVDRRTQERTPKPSAFWLGKVARNNTLLTE